MATNNEEKKPQQEPKTSASKSAMHTTTLLTKLSLVSALAAIVLAIYTVQYSMNLQQSMQADNKQLAAQINELKQTQSSSLEQVDTKAQNFVQAQNDLQGKMDTLNHQLQNAMNQRLYQNQDWLLLKARYLLELAQTDAYWSHNYTTASALLQQADDVLKQINSPKIFDVRQAIAKEITLLKGANTLDVAGLLSQLDALQLGVGKLAIETNMTDTEATNSTASPTASTPSTWRTRLHGSLNLLEKLVVVRRDNEDVKPLLTPLFESLLRESIRMNLQEAQWAILNNNAAVFQLSLKQASQNLKRTFSDKEQNTEALIKQIDTLAATQLNPEKPELGLALPLLNRLIDSNELHVKQKNDNAQGESKE